MTSRASQLALPIGVVGVVLLLVVPLPSAFLDLLIAFNITAAIAILLVSMYIRRPLDFSIFPSLILVLTLLRLSLNVSATRLVLRDGYAGKVIDSFGHFVVGGSLVIGLVIFLILVVIQFAVITNGAGRVAEVGARFTLDAMPGKQMAIDADLNSGLIDEDEARRRRADVTAEADFYGAMDGGSKFVKGDAIAAIVITIINLVGGFAIGMLQRGLSPAEALQTYSLLTIGDGLVSQIPALLLSVATGLIVTRSTTNGDMGTDAAAQIGAQPRALFIAGAAAIGIGLLPGIPKLPFILVGAAVLLIAQRTSSGAAKAAKTELTVAAANAPSQEETPDSLMGEMRVDPLEVVLAPDLVDLVDSGVGGDLLDRVRALRRKLALQLGLVMPPVRTRDSLDLPQSGYSIRISGVEVGRGQAPPGHVLAIGEDLDNVPGRPTTEPVFGLAGKWVPVEARQQAELYGASVVDRSSVLITHLAEIVQTHAARLLGREDVKALVESVRRTHPVVVEELTPALMTTGEVQRVLQALLAEGVSVRDLVRVFEALSQRAKAGSDLDGLVEASRLALGPAICDTWARDGVLQVMTLDPVLEQQLVESARPTETGTVIALPGGTAERVVDSAMQRLVEAERTGAQPVLVCPPLVRAALRRLLAPHVPRLPVLSYAEIDPTLQIETTGVVNVGTAIAA
ncbi:flagellar biosynthesis protein FlhA [Angustibacter luteus]|uniref:Flagellar biosynthesis protein FlhA n=1 Tax=Angustibacter luteus TaxID=658456 RepID=A0ABW1JHY0_9ACTN